MSEPTYKILFKGKTVRGYEPEKAKQNFARLFKLPLPKVEVLFNGSERVLKKSLSLEQANDFRAKLKKFGIRVSLKQNEVVAPQTSDELSLSEPGVMIVPPVRKPDVHIEITHINLDDDEGPIVERAAIEEPMIDLSELKLDEVGQQIVKKVEVDAPDIDVGDLILDDPGATMVEKEYVPVPEISLEGLNLDELGVDLVTKKKAKPAEISIEHIQMVEEEDLIQES